MARGDADTQPVAYRYDGPVMNETLLQQYNLVFYEGNNTLSNNSVCYYIPTPLADSPAPAYTMFTNGTIVPEPSLCSDPVLPIQLHARLGILFGCLFLIPLLFCLASLRQLDRDHRQLALHEQWAVRRQGRRQYYWILLTSVMGMLTCFISIDVDREAVTGLTFEVQCILYSLQQPLLLLSLYESVDLWYCSSRGFRRITDDDDEDSHGTFWNNEDTVWTGAFCISNLVSTGLVEIRNWNALTHQWYDVQAENVAKKAATDARFQTGYLIMLVCFFVIIIRLTTNMSNAVYREKLICLIGVICLTCSSVTYLVVSTFRWEISPYNAVVKQIWYYAFECCLVIVLTLLSRAGWWTFAETSSHPDISMQTDLRHRVPRKPSWWRYSRSRKLNDATCDMRLDDIRTVRGREDDYCHANSGWWWWQKHDSDRPHPDTKADEDGRTEFAQFDAMDTREASGPALSKSASRYDSLLPQDMSVRSLLGI